MLSNNDSHGSGQGRGWLGLVAFVIGSVLLLFTVVTVIVFVGGVLSDEPTDDVGGFVIATAVVLLPGVYLVRWSRRHLGHRRLRATVVIVLLLVGSGGMGLLIMGLARLVGSKVIQVPDRIVPILMIAVMFTLFAPLFLFVFAFFPKWSEANLIKGRQGRASGFESAVLRLSEHPKVLWWSYVGFILGLWVLGGLLIGLSSS